MPKRLLLVAEEGPVKQLDESQEAVNFILKNRFQDLIFKVMSYDPDYPEDVTYHVGQTMKFISNSRFVPNGDSHGIDEPSEEEKGIRSMMSKLWEGSKPALKEFAREVWMNKKDFQQWKEDQRKEKQRILDASKGPLEKQPEKIRETSKISTETLKLKEPVKE